MRDAHDLSVARYVGDRMTDDLGYRAAHARIHLVKHVGADRAFVREDTFEREQCARQFASTRNLAQRPWFLSPIRRNQKLDPIDACT
jgi:hypothetical protein